MQRFRFYLEDINQPCFKDKEVLYKIRRVLRLKKKDIIYVFDGKGKEYSAEIVNFSSQRLDLKIKSLSREVRNRGVSVSLAFSLLKSGKNELIFQKATELGIDKFLPFFSEYSLKKSISFSKFRRFERIIKESAAQSGRLFLPLLEKVYNFGELLERLGEFEKILLAEFQAEKFLEVSLIQDSKNILLLVGPEGGFSKEEVVQLKDKGSISVKLSSNILRAETAAIFFSGLVIYYLKR